MKTFYIESLGCPKNTIDTEHVLGLLDEDFAYAEDPETADYILINTCAFIHDAEAESYEYIETYVNLRESRRKNRHSVVPRIIVLGCLAQAQTEALLSKYEADAVVGTGSFFKMREVIERLESGERDVVLKDSIDTVFPVLPRVVTTPDYFAYLKIAEGCDNRCTYCMIPSLRGRYRSRSIEELTEEAAALDVDELILIAQDTSRYGTDLYGKPSLADLLYALNEIPRIRWIRVHYLYPDLLDGELIDTFFSLEKVVAYFDIPVQHVSDKILGRMNRNTSCRDLRNIFRQIREKEVRYGKKASIRTTFIVGFPGETEGDFAELVDFVEAERIDRLGVFTYSDSERIASHKFSGKVDADTAASRKERIMLLQQEKSAEWLESLIGTETEAVVEEYLPDEDLYVCRTALDAPEIDGELFLYSDAELEIGDFVRVKITGSAEYDLVGEFYEYCE